MPMNSLFQGFEAGLRLAEPVSRGIETRARAGLEGEMFRDNRDREDRRDRLREEMLRARDTREGEFHRRRMDAPQTEFEALDREVEQAFAAIGRLNGEAEEALARGDARALEKIQTKSALYENLIRQKLAGLQQGKPVRPNAKVTRRPDGSVSATYEVPMDDLDAYLSAADRSHDPYGHLPTADRVEVEMLDEEIDRHADAIRAGNDRSGRIPGFKRDRRELIRGLERRREEILSRAAPAGTGPATGPEPFRPFDPAAPEASPPPGREAAAPPAPGSLDAILQGAAEADRRERERNERERTDRTDRNLRRVTEAAIRTTP